MQQAIIWTNDGLVHWCVYASLGTDELKSFNMIHMAVLIYGMATNQTVWLLGIYRVIWVYCVKLERAFQTDRIEIYDKGDNLWINVPYSYVGMPPGQHIHYSFCLFRIPKHEGKLYILVRFSENLHKRVARNPHAWYKYIVMHSSANEEAYG